MAPELQRFISKRILSLSDLLVSDERFSNLYKRLYTPLLCYALGIREDHHAPHLDRFDDSLVSDIQNELGDSFTELLTRWRNLPVLDDPERWLRKTFSLKLRGLRAKHAKILAFRANHRDDYEPFQNVEAPAEYKEPDTIGQLEFLNDHQKNIFASYDERPATIEEIAAKQNISVRTIKRERAKVRENAIKMRKVQFLILVPSRPNLKDLSRKIRRDFLHGLSLEDAARIYQVDLAQLKDLAESSKWGNEKAKIERERVRPVHIHTMKSRDMSEVREAYRAGAEIVDIARITQRNPFVVKEHLKCNGLLRERKTAKELKKTRFRSEHGLRFWPDAQRERARVHLILPPERPEPIQIVAFVAA